MNRKSYRQSSVHEYINITKQLPSSNPIRSPTPDIHSRKERIERTPSPNIVFDRSSLKNITNSHSKAAGTNKDYEALLEAKNAKIAALQKELDALQKGLRNSSSSFNDSEKLRALVKQQEEENHELRRRMDLSVQENNAKTDNKIREILLKFYQEINVLKAENRQLTEKIEGKKPGSLHDSRPLDNSSQISDHSNPEKSKKAAQHTQGGSVSPYHEPRPQHGQPYHEPQPPQNQHGSAYEEQIHKLKASIAEKDALMRALAEELERLNDVLKKKAHENEVLQEKLRSSGQSFDEPLKLKSLLQSKLQELEELKSKLPKEDTEKMKSLAAKVPMMAEEIKQLNEVIEKLRKENHENEEKIRVLAQEIERLTDLLKVHGHPRQHEEKIALLAQEIERLTEIIRGQNAEIHRLRPIEGQMEPLKKDHDILQEKYNSKNKALESKLKELELLKEKCLLIDKAFTAEKEGLHEKAKELEKKAHSLESENQEISKLHRKSIADKETHEQEALRLQALSQELALEIKRLTDSLKARIAENEAKNQEIEALRHRLVESESNKSAVMNSHDMERKRSQIALQENDRKNLIIESLSQEITGLRNRILELESKLYSQERDHEKVKKAHHEASQNVGNLQNQLDLLHGRHQDKSQAFEAELRQKDEDLRELRQKLMHLEEDKEKEIAKARNSITETQIRHEHEKRKTLGVMAEKEGLQMEVEVLRKEKSDLQTACNELKKALLQASTECQQYRKGNEECLARIAILSALSESALNDLAEYRSELSEMQKIHSEKSLEEIKLKESLNETKQHHEREKRKSISIMAEKDALSKTLDLVSKDKEDLHKRLYDHEVRNIDYQSQLRTLSQRFEEALIRIVILSAEVERLNDSLGNEANLRRNELEELKRDFEGKLMGLNERKRKEIEELKSEFDSENKRLLNTIKSMEEQNEGLLRKHNNDRAEFIGKYEKAMKETIAKNIKDMNESHQQELEQVQNRISEHQKLADKYKQELEKMAGIMSEKHEEVANWREKVQKLEQQRILELEELKKHLDLLKSSYVNNPPGMEFQAERLAYETNINQLKSRINTLESALKEKNSKHESLLRESESRNQELRLKLRNFESSKDGEMSGINEMNERLKRQFEETRERLQRSESETRRLELESKQMQIAISALRSELEQTQKSLEMERLESSRLATRLKENEKLYKSSSEDLYREDKSQRVKDLENEIRELSRTRDEYRDKAERNERALTEMNGALVEKIQELERMKSRYHESINNVHLLEGKLLEKLQEDEVFIS